MEDTAKYGGCITDMETMDFVATENGKKVLTMDEHMRAACWIVCPMCDEPKCVGRFNCPEIKAWVEKKKNEQAANNG